MRATNVSLKTDKKLSGVTTFTIGLSFIKTPKGFIITDCDNGFDQKTVFLEKQATIIMNAYGGFVMKF